MASPSNLIDIRMKLSGGRAVVTGIRDVRDETGKLGRATGKTASELTTHYKRIGESAKRYFGYASAAAAGLAIYGLKDVVEKGMAFEKQMSVNAAVSEANAHQMLALEKQSMKLGKATFYSAKEAADAQGELVKGGLSVEQVLGGALPAALSLAEAGQLDLADAATTTVNSMKLFGLQGKDAGSIADMLATAANRTTADVGDFSEALKYGGSVSKLAGYNLNETVTVLEALAESGIKGSMAGTTFKTAMIHLLAPTKKQSDLQKELGLHILTGNGHLKDAAALSTELHKALDGKTKAEQTAILSTLAGQRGVIGLNALYAKTPGYLEALEKANAKQGTAQEVAAKKMDNFAGTWEQFKGSLETTELAIYKGIEPALSSLTGEAEGALNHISAIFENEKLSGSQKTERAIHVLTDELESIWKNQHIGEHLVDALDAAIPIVANSSGRLGLTMASSVAEGFTHANLIGKVAIAGYVLNLFGGGVIAKAGARKVGGMIGMEMGIGLATGATGAFIAYEIWEHMSKQMQAEVIITAEHLGADFANYFIRKIRESPVGEVASFFGVEIPLVETNEYDQTPAEAFGPPIGTGVHPGIGKELGGGGSHGRSIAEKRRSYELLWGVPPPAGPPPWPPPKGKGRRHRPKHQSVEQSLIGGGGNGPIHITVQSVLDGKVIAESTAKHARSRAAFK